MEKIQAAESEEQLIQTHAKLVSALAGRFLYSGQEFEDLYQVGMVGLLRAVRNFDVSRGLCFSTYAVPVILGEIRRYLRDDGVIKVSRSLKENYVLLRRAEQRLTKQNGVAPTLSELCRETNLTREEILQATEAGTRPLSLESPLGEDGNLLLGDTVPAEDQEGLLDTLELKEGISRLDPKDRQLILLRYYYARTQQQTAEAMQMTQVQVSRREKKILQCLRERMLDSE